MKNCTEYSEVSFRLFEKEDCLGRYPWMSHFFFWKICDPFDVRPLVGFEHLRAEQFLPNYTSYFADLPE